jgi:hypothetical protein
MKIFGGELIDGRKVSESHSDVYWVEVSHKPVEKLRLTYSKEVALESAKRRVFRDWEHHKHERARKDTGALLERGIQVYRLWFRFLKLALELERLGVSKLIVSQGTKRRSVASGGGGAKWRCRKWVRLNIQKERYAGWNLDSVLTDTFDEWWRTHSHLFEGYSPSFITSTDKLSPDFLYVRIDPATKLEDVKRFVTDEVQPKLRKKAQFAVEGYPKPRVLQNAYNALVLTLKGVEPKEVCTSSKIYLRATQSQQTDRLAVSTNPKTGKPLYSLLVSAQRDAGIHHLLEVMEGRFGRTAPK